MSSMDKSIEAARLAVRRALEKAHGSATCHLADVAVDAAIAAYRDAEIADLRAKLEVAHNAKRIAEERELEAAQELDAFCAKLEAAERDASQLREAASAMLDKIDYNINNERLPLTYTVPWEQAVALRRAVRKETAIDAARGGERG